MAESTHNHQKANRLTGLLILAISQHVCPPFNISPSFVPHSPCFLSSSLSVGVYSVCVCALESVICRQPDWWLNAFVFVWLYSSSRGLEAATCSFIIFLLLSNPTVRYFCYTDNHSFINPCHHKHTLAKLLYIIHKFTQFILYTAISDRNKSRGKLSKSNWKTSK